MFDMTMEMGDLAAMLQQGSQDFSMDNLMNGTQSLPQSQNPIQPPPESQMQGMNPQPLNPSIPTSAPNGNESITNAEADQLLAQLDALADPNTNIQQPLLDNGTGNVNEDDINALLASLGDVNEQDFANFDFSSNLDMGNLGEMAGLFNTTTTVEPDEKPDLPTEPNLDAFGSGSVVKAEPQQQQSNGDDQAPIDLTSDEVVPALEQPPQAAAPSEPQTQQPQIDSQATQPQPQSQSQSQPQPQSESHGNASLPLPDISLEPKKEENPLDQLQDNDFSGIDMDDFNFRDGDENQEGMGMSGDEFDRLLAGAFND